MRMCQGKRWSKLQRELYLIIAPELDFQIHCCAYRMQSQYGGTAMPRYWITLEKEIIFDYPKQFVNKNGMINDLSNKAPNEFYPYVNDVSDISDLIREYIDTDKNEVFEKHFENDCWGLINILKAADKRNGTGRLKRLKRKTNNKAANKIIDLRIENS